jgi:hypothetical protein
VRDKKARAQFPFDEGGGQRFSTRGCRESPPSMFEWNPAAAAAATANGTLLEQRRKSPNGIAPQHTNESTSVEGAAPTVVSTLTAIAKDVAATKIADMEHSPKQVTRPVPSRAAAAVQRGRRSQPEMYESCPTTETCPTLAMPPAPAYCAFRVQHPNCPIRCVKTSHDHDSIKALLHCVQ